MAKGRFLSKSVSTSRKLSQLKSDSTRLVWTWLLPHLDREGRFHADPVIIKGHALPYLKHHTEETIAAALQELAETKLIFLYAVNREPYLQFTQFDRNQPGLRKDREAESQCPPPPEELLNESGVTPELIGEVSKQALKLKYKLKLKDKDKPEELGTEFYEFWKAYPQAGRHAKKESGIRFGALVKRGELKEFIDGFHGYLDFLKHKKVDDGFDQEPMYAKTFLNGRWKEFIGYKFEPRK